MPWDEPRITEMSSFGQRWEAYRPSKTLLFWSCAACVVATIVVGFNWGGWTTGGTATAMAKEAATGARQELAASVCVDRFQGADDAGTQLVALKGLKNAWDRGTFVEKGGWAAMPGPKTSEPASRAARACADQLALLEVPPPPPPAASAIPAAIIAPAAAAQ